MQFVKNGPDIPERLLHEHENGRVIFFCGAGISYPAGLPGFKGLVDKIYDLVGTDREAVEEVAYSEDRFDATLDLLERRLAGQRLAVRRKLTQALKPNLRRKGATDTHAALLRLARNREGALRLVTTNFDRVFHAAAKRAGQAFPEYAAPMLPIPKNSRWNGLVYLHGLLPEKPDDTSLNRLVVTSGDFGLAYLTERWAARFVSELFRNYLVCFVGYSINDPVLRYMMDALTADRMLGEDTPMAWALGECEPGKQDNTLNEWRAKGVTPILYQVPDSDDHSALHETLHSWAKLYQEGVPGKESIVDTYALATPSESTQEDDFVGRMLWALSDRSGLPAKRFADFNPVPSLDWLLDAFAKERFQHSDLTRFGVSPRNEVDADLPFSLIRRPAPYYRSSSMQLVSDGNTDSQWDVVMFHMARWLVRHLDDPRLVLWIAQCGGQLHHRLQDLIDEKLNHFALLEHQGKTAELDAIRSHAPNAIPRSLMRTLWYLLLSGRVKSKEPHLGLYHWKERLKQEGLTATLRWELRELLTPKLLLKGPSFWGFKWGDTDNPTQISQLVDYELVLASDYVRSALGDFTDESWTASLPQLLDIFQQLLLDALDLFRELGEADDRIDLSRSALPSISPHWQNRGSRVWVILIELLRDAWLAVRSNDSVRAVRIAQMWFDLPYPTFKRLALFAASQDGCISPDQWVDWLVADGSWWFWSSNTGREVFRLLVLQGCQLTGTAQERLESAILVGPPREMYRDNLEPDDWQFRVDRSVWLRLAKLNASRLTLGPLAASHLVKLSEANPQWQLEAHEREEFSTWMSGTGDPDYDGKKDINIAPRKRSELVQWLTKPRPQPFYKYEDTWSDVCCTRFFHSLYALCDLAKDGIWPTDRWGEALQSWRQERMVLRSWHYAAPLVETMPDNILQEIVNNVTRWIDTVSSLINQHEEILLNLCHRVLSLPPEAGTEKTHEQDEKSIDLLLLDAEDHPVWRVTQALINLWSKRNPEDNDLLPADIKPFFTELCNVDRFRHGRVLLGLHLIALFRVDRPWVEQYLFPLLSWENPDEAIAVWKGFLRSPSLYQPLLVAIKPQFLECVNHYDDLGEHGQKYAAFLTYMALEKTEGYTVEEFRSAIGLLPQEGLERSADELSQALEGAGDQCEEYWKNHVQPFWLNVWPKSRNRKTPEIAQSLTDLIIAAGSEFPAALDEMQDWLQPFKNLSSVVKLLHESGLCSKFPVDTLRLLDAIIAQQMCAPPELGLCLNEIVQAAPHLAQDGRFMRLQVYCRKRGV